MAVAWIPVSALASAIMSQSLMRILDSFKRDKNLERDFENEVGCLGSNIATIEKYKVAIILGNKEVYEWYIRLEDAMYRGANVLDAYVISLEEGSSQERLKTKIMNLLYTSSIHWIAGDSCRSVAHAIGLINKEIDKILEEGNKNKYHQIIESQVKEYPNMRSMQMPFKDYPIIGRDDIMSDIIQRLTIDYKGESIRVLPIVGMGGIGKTTLAHSIYQTVQTQFDYSGWLTLSALAFDTKTLLKDVLLKFTNDEKTLGPSLDLNGLATSFAKVVKDKRFLLVIDDMWVEGELEVSCTRKKNLVDRLQELFDTLKQGKGGSWLIITTRETKVVEKIKKSYTDKVELEPPIRLGVLADEDLWSIVKSYAFGVNAQDEARNFESFGKEIVRKLKGLPLAAKAIGRVLNGQELSYWVHIERHDLWALLENHEDSSLVPSLVLSFLHLSPEAKSCFTYCSLFSGQIDEEELVYQLLAHNYVSAEDTGKTILSDMQSMSLFTIEKDDSTEKRHVHMHDLIHDMSVASGRDDHLQVQNEGSLGSLLPRRTRHLRVDARKYFSDELLKKTAECKMLRTLMIQDQSWVVCHQLKVSTLCAWFKKLECLRVLALNGFEIGQLPDEISELKHLRYLDLSYNIIKRLPRTLTNLIQLQTLILRRLKTSSSTESLWNSPKDLDIFSRFIKLRYLDLSENHMRTLPQSIMELSDLRVLKLNYSYMLRELPKGIDNLKRLETLSLRHSWNIKMLPKDLGSLTHLRKLDIYGCYKLTALGNQLENLKNLRYLCVDEPIMSTIQKIGKLTSLETLRWKYHYPYYRCEAHQILELVNLNMLRGKIEIRKLDELNSSATAEQVRLQQKIHLEELSLRWSGYHTHTRDVKNEEEVLECLKPSKNLTKLVIHNYIGTSLPHWLTSQYLRILKHLSLCGLLHIPVIEIYQTSKEMEKGDHIFPFMEELKFYNLPCLQNFSLAGKSNGWLFPRLQSFRIFNCQKLERVPDMPLSLRCMQLRRVMLIELPAFRCQGDYDRGGRVQKCSNNVSLSSFSPVSSISTIEIRFCRLLSSLKGVLESKLPFLQRLVIVDCDNLKDPPKYGFKECKLLQVVELRNCPKLQKLSTESDIALPSQLEELVITNCISLEAESLQMSLQALTSLGKLELENCCSHMSNFFVEASVAAPLVSSKTCEVSFRDKRLDMRIHKYRNISFHWKYNGDDINDSCFRSELLIHLLEYLHDGPSSITELFICMARIDLTLVKQVLSSFSEKLVECHISSNEMFQLYWKQTDHVAAGISWDCKFNVGTGELTGNIGIRKEEVIRSDLIRKEVLEEMLERIPPSLVQKLSVAGIHDVTVIDGHLERLFLNLITLNKLTITYWESLCYFPANFSRLTSLETLEIRHCNGIRDLSSLNNNPFPWLHKLLIIDCMNLENPSAVGFTAFASLKCLHLINCPKLSRLSLEDDCDFPPHLRQLEITNCRGLETESLQMSLNLQAISFLRELKLVNCCHHMSNLFVKNIVVPLLKSINRCEIRYHDLQLTIEKDSENSFSQVEVHFHWDYKAYDHYEQKPTTERERGCSRVELLKRILKCLGPSTIKHLEIQESHNLLLISNMMGQLLPTLINHATSLTLCQTGPVTNLIRRPNDFYMHIDGCERITSLKDGIFNYSLPWIRHMTISCCVKLRDPPRRGFTTLTSLKSLTLSYCPELRRLSVEEGSALPPSLQELVIIACRMLDICSIEKSLQTPFISLEKLGLYSICDSPHFSSSFVKIILTHLLPRHNGCSKGLYRDYNISSSKIDFTWRTPRRDRWYGLASADLKETKQEDSYHSCTGKELLSEMLKWMPCYNINKLVIKGCSELEAIDCELKDLLLKHTRLHRLKFSHCRNLCYLPVADMSRLPNFKKLWIRSCDKLPQLKPNEYPSHWIYRHSAHGDEKKEWKEESEEEEDENGEKEYMDDEDKENKADEEEDWKEASENLDIREVKEEEMKNEESYTHKDVEENAEEEEAVLGDEEEEDWHDAEEADWHDVEQEDWQADEEVDSQVATSEKFEYEKETRRWFGTYN